MPEDSKKEKKPSWKPTRKCRCCGMKRVLVYNKQLCKDCAVNTGKMCPDCQVVLGGRVKFMRPTNRYICENCHKSWPANDIVRVKPNGGKK